MASTYQSALIDQLDPTLQKKPMTQDDPMTGGTIDNTGFNGGSVPIPMTPKVEGPSAASNGGFAGPDQSTSTPAPIAAPGGGLGNPTIDAFNAAKGKGFMVGFDPGKLNSDYSNTKYSPAAKFTAQASQMMPIQRGNLQDFVGLAQSQGFKDAKLVGDDKVDFGDGNGPIDIIRADGQPVFQNTTGNGQWEAQYGHGGGGASSDGGGDAGHANPIIQGSPTASIDQALSSYGQPSNLIQQLIAQLQGGG